MADGRRRDLAAILRAYRHTNQLSQEQLAGILGYDRTYISMIETRRRRVDDVRTRRHIAHKLDIPAHLLGITDGDDADFAAMLQFGDSTIRLAESVHRSGRTVEAITELWPLVARLEARAAERRLDRQTLVLLARGQVTLGITLGTVLPEERLANAARWTGKALRIAKHLDDTTLLAHTLRMHGNELRKAHQLSASVARLTQAVEISPDREGRGTAYALLARAAGEQGDLQLFDRAMVGYRTLLETDSMRGMLFNPFTFREVHLRGLLATGRAADAIRIMTIVADHTLPFAPQWSTIERITASEILLAAGARDDAAEALRVALVTAESHQLPHQVQRAIRISDKGGLPEISENGHLILGRLTAASARALSGYTLPGGSTT